MLVQRFASLGRLREEVRPDNPGQRFGKVLNVDRSARVRAVAQIHSINAGWQEKVTGRSSFATACAITNL